MFAAINQFFAAFAMLFAAAENSAAAINNLSLIGREKSDSFLDQSRAQRTMEQNKLRRQVKLSETKDIDLDAPAAPATPFPAIS